MTALASNCVELVEQQGPSVLVDNTCEWGDCRRSAASLDGSMSAVMSSWLGPSSSRSHASNHGRLRRCLAEARPGESGPCCGHAESRRETR